MAPRVTVIVPARDEAAYIEACVASIRRQEVDGGLEVLVVDGLSADGTPELARRAGARVIENAERTIPAGLNRGLSAATGDIVVRFDAHAEMPDGYVDACIRALAAERAANVGGWRAVRPRGPWGRALGHALASPLGVANARIWREPAPAERRREVDTVPLGCFPASTLREAGGWDERLLANEDYELNDRLRRRGGRVVFDPGIRSVYRPRESLREIAAQYVRYGRWKAAMLEESPRSVRPRQLAPPALMAAAVAAVVPSPLRRPARAGLVLYGATLAAEGRRRRGGWRVPVVLATMHAAWGAGLLSGAVAAAARRATGRGAARRAAAAPAGSSS